MVHSDSYILEPTLSHYALQNLFLAMCDAAPQRRGERSMAASLAKILPLCVWVGLRLLRAGCHGQYILVERI